MDKQLVFSLAEVKGTLSSVIREVEDFELIIETLLSSLLLQSGCGTNFARYLLKEHNIHEEEIDRLMDFLLYRIEMFIASKVRSKMPDDHYIKTYKLQGLVVVVTITKKPPVSNYDLLKEEIIVGIENGDYFPPALRHMVGYE